MPKKVVAVEWEVSRILCHRNDGTQYVYRVKWKCQPGMIEDWPEKDNWVSHYDLNCPILLQSYWSKQGYNYIPLFKPSENESKKKKKKSCISVDSSDSDAPYSQENDVEDETYEPVPKKKKRCSNTNRSFFLNITEELEDVCCARAVQHVPFKLEDDPKD